MKTIQLEIEESVLTEVERATRALEMTREDFVRTALERALQQQAHLSNAVVQASINAIGASDNIAQAVGQPSEDVRQLVDESNRWTAAEAELRMTLDGVAGANLVRRQRIALISGQAYGIAVQLARDPAHAVLLPHVREVKRLRSFKRRKKAQPAPLPPTPVPQVPATVWCPSMMCP